MATIKINDGLGTGSEVGVDNFHRLEVDAVTQSELAFASRSGSAYAVAVTHTIAQTGVEEPLFLFQNESASDLVIVSKNTTALVNLTDGYYATFRVYFDGTYVSGGVAVPTINMNLTSGKRAGTVVYSNISGDLSVSFDPGKLYFETQLSSTSPYAQVVGGDSIVVMGPGDGAFLTVTGKAGTMISESANFIESVTDTVGLVRRVL